MSRSLRVLAVIALLAACSRGAERGAPVPRDDSIEWREMEASAGVGDSWRQYYPRLDELTRDQAVLMIGACLGVPEYTCAEALVERFPDLRGEDWSPIWPYAAQYAHSKHLGLLLERGAGADPRAVVWIMQRSRADQRAERLALMAALIKAGAALETRDDEGLTPLLRAARDGDADLVRLLLAKGARSRARTSQGLSARDLAEAQGAVDVLALLPD